MAVTLQQILNTAYPAYAATHRQPRHVHRAVSALRRCRTGALGHHAVTCPAGHVVDVRPNSCRHRSCPQCGGRKAAQWLDAWQGRLLPTTHFQVVFTLPPILHTLWRWNRRLFTRALFDTARAALLELLAEDRHLGARPGLVVALHTWGSALPLHLHLHALVTGGGMAPDGRWRPSRAHFLLWAPILRTVFQGILLARLRELFEQDALVLPPPLRLPDGPRLLDDAAQCTWHVRIEPPYTHGRGLVMYLARYLKGGPIKNHRLVTFNGTDVCFRYRDYRRTGRPKWRSMTVPVAEFLHRWVQHVPVPGLHMVRAYGLYATHERPALARCRVQLGPRWCQPPPAAPAPARERCPQCGAPLVTSALARPRAPQPHEKPTGPGPPRIGMSN